MNSYSECELLLAAAIIVRYSKFRDAATGVRVRIRQGDSSRIIEVVAAREDHCSGLRI